MSLPFPYRFERFLDPPLQKRVRDALRFLRTKPRTETEMTALRGCVSRDCTVNDEGPLYRLDDESMQRLEVLIDAVSLSDHSLMNDNVCMQLERECDEYRAWVHSQIGPLWAQLESWWDKCHTPPEERARLRKADPGACGRGNTCDRKRVHPRREL